MFVKYMWCDQSREGDRAEFITAFDPEPATALDYTELGCNESLWFVPGTEE